MARGYSHSSHGCCPPVMAMEREMNRIPSGMDRKGPGRGATPGVLAMHSEVNPLPKGLGGGGRGEHRVGEPGHRNRDNHAPTGGFHSRNKSHGKTFKERREEIRGRR